MDPEPRFSQEMFAGCQVIVILLGVWKTQPKDSMDPAAEFSLVPKL